MTPRIFTKPTGVGGGIANPTCFANMAPLRIAIVYYSAHGHIRKMAQQVLEGINSVEGCEAIMYQVKETLPPEILEKIRALPKADDPVMTAEELPSFDGLVFGIPTRYGSMPAQMRALWDATGGLWAKGALVGKPVSAFCSTGTQGGGQEMTILTSLSTFVHHGMIYVPMGYSLGPNMFSLEEVRGGSAWGAGTFAGADGSRQPSPTELAYAKHQGSYFAKVVKKLAADSE